MNVISKFNIATRRALGSVGPISPGRAALVGGAAYGTVRFGIPKMMVWMGRELWVPTATLTWGTVIASIVFIEGACYLFGDDYDVVAADAVTQFRSFAEKTLSNPAREQALVRQSGLDKEQMHGMLLAMKEIDLQSAAAKRAQEEAAEAERQAGRAKRDAKTAAG